MLTRPVYGWSDFQLDGTDIYELSYCDDIAFEWIEQAIHGLKTMLPFCVKNFMEPGRFLCVVSYWNCHIICEDNGRSPLSKEDVTQEISHTSMLDFCRYLYHDINKNIDEWALFADYGENKNLKTEKDVLTGELEELRKLIIEREPYFDENHCFL